MALSDEVVRQALAIANDNRFRYYNISEGETNGLGAVTVPYTMDCDTFLSYSIYRAKGWNWYNQPYGYFWSHITQSGYDSFLVNTIGCTKLTYNSSLGLLAGDIIITTETLGHALMYIGNGEIVDANNFFGYGANSIAVRTYPTYATSNFAFVYRFPDQPSPPQPVVGKKKMPLYMMLRHPYKYT